MKHTYVRVLGTALAVCAACASPHEDWREEVPTRPAGEAPGATAPALAGVGAPEAPVSVDEHSTLDDLVRFASSNNPGLMAAFDRWHAALERVPQAEALPAPRLTLAGYLAEVETRTGPMRSRFGLAQSFPWFGKRGASASVAEHRAEAAAHEVDAAHLALRNRVLDAWYELGWLGRAIEITERHRELLLRWEEVARGQFESGRGSHADVIRAQVELGKLENRVQALRDLRRPTEARLNAALGRAPGGVLPAPANAAFDASEVDGAALQASLAQTSPSLAAHRRRIEAAEQALVLAEKEFWPDFTLGVDYTVIGDARSPGVSGSGDDAFALSLGIELPIWRAAYRAGEREARSRLSAARRTLDDALNELASELEMALFEHRDAHRRVDLFRHTLIPKGEESVASSDAEYRSGNRGFLDLLDAERVLLEFQLQTVRAEADRAQSLAEIERITGVTPGHRGVTPGHRGGATDHMGGAPGHTGEAPGHMGEAPGHMGEAPGARNEQ